MYDDYPPSVSMYMKVKNLKEGDKFIRPTRRGELRTIRKWIRDGYVDSASRTKYIIKKQVKPFTKTQKIHDYITSHKVFTIEDCANAVGCSKTTVSTFLRAYGKLYNIKQQFKVGN